MQIQTILLAAGSSSRFGGDKLAAPLVDGTPLVLASAQTLLAAGCDVLAVVRDADVGPGALLAGVPGIEVRACPQAALGLGHSLAFGVRNSDSADAWVVALADMPFVRPATVARVAVALTRGASLVAPVFARRRGHPVGFARDWQAQLVALTGDAGARSLLARHAGALTLLDTDDPGVLRDVDRIADLAKRSAPAPIATAR